MGNRGRPIFLRKLGGVHAKMTMDFARDPISFLTAVIMAVMACSIFSVRPLMFLLAFSSVIDCCLIYRKKIRGHKSERCCK